MFSRLDADGDGKLSRDVLESRLGGGGAMAERMLARLDTDGSGGVSKDEFDAAMKRLAEMRHQGGDGKWGRRRN